MSSKKTFKDYVALSYLRPLFSEICRAKRLAYLGGAAFLLELKGCAAPPE